MDWLDKYAQQMAAGMWKGVSEVTRDFAADVGNAYQAFLMADAGWRVPGAHDMQIAQAAQAEMEQRIIPERSITVITIGPES
jgi:hypothetical protein